MQDRTPFTYHVFWTALNKGYIGCRYGKGCHPSDLGTSYFSSSTETQALWQQQQPDVIEITEYSTPEEALAAESALIRQVALKDERYLNKSCCSILVRSGEEAPNYGRRFTAEHKEKISKNNKSGTPEVRAKIAAALAGNPRSAETRAAISKAKKGNPSNKKGLPLGRQRKGITVPVHTPLGDFASGHEAATAHGFHITTLYNRLKKSPDEYYYLR